MANLPPIQDMLISHRAPISEALAVIDKNAQGICFVVDETGKLCGVLTDGDIRRGFIRKLTVDTRVVEVMQTTYTSFPVGTDDAVLRRQLSDKIRHIPLVDEEGKPVDYSCAHRMHRFPVMEPLLGGNELAYVTECVTTNWISSQGRFVTRFEELVAEYVGVPYALAVSNGTVALQLALDALGIGPGDEVILPDLTFAATINSVIHVGATPVIADVDPDTWNIAPAEIERLITPKTRCIMPVHLYGLAANMEAILAIAQKNNLLVIEDAAEAIGSAIKGKQAGSFGDAATFSFFGNKTVTTGEGGMVLFKDEASYEKAKVLRDHGMSKSKRYWHDYVGYNFRMTNLQAAIGVAQMERIEEIVSQKVQIGEWYVEALSEIADLQLPYRHADYRNTYWLMTVVIRSETESLRDEVLKKLLINGVEGRPCFYPLHEMPVYQQWLRAGQEFPVSTKVSREGLSLPSSLLLEQKNILTIVNMLDSVIKQIAVIRKK